MEVYPSDNEIFIYQSKYPNDIEKALYVYSNSLPISRAYVELLCKDDGASKIYGIMYKSIIECLIFITNFMLDILHVVKGMNSFGIYYYKNEEV